MKNDPNLNTDVDFINYSPFLCESSQIANLKFVHIYKLQEILNLFRLFCLLKSLIYRTSRKLKLEYANGTKVFVSGRVL